MGRTPPTQGNFDFLQTYIETMAAKAQGHAPEQKRERFIDAIRTLQATIAPIETIRHSGAVEPSTPKCLPDSDETAHLSLDQKGWHDLMMEVFAHSFGRGGLDSVSCLAEAAHYANALAHKFGASAIYFRGEHRFGHKLQSKAERKIPAEEGYDSGLTKTEVSELRRFQSETLADAELVDEIWDGKAAPHEDSPQWLPVMQHYDTRFGTRLIDVTTSIFSGLYFACVSWNGQIDENVDGLVYCMPNSSLHVRGWYFDEPQPHRTKAHHEDDEYAPESVLDSFRDWDSPEVLRVYKSASSSGREMAQDGMFLVKGAFGGSDNFGQIFKLRVPADAKLYIAKELWFAGYTPSRIVRGPIGREAEESLRRKLELPDY